MEFRIPRGPFWETQRTISKLAGTLGTQTSGWWFQPTIGWLSTVNINGYY